MMEAKKAPAPRVVNLKISVAQIMAFCRVLDNGREGLLAKDLKNQIISQLAGCDFDEEEEEDV